MFRQIITANSATFEIKIPEEMRGKKIEILAFEIDNDTDVNKSTTPYLPSEDFFSKHHINLSSYKFNREEANDYD